MNLDTSDNDALLYLRSARFAVLRLGVYIGNFPFAKFGNLKVIACKLKALRALKYICIFYVIFNQGWSNRIEMPILGRNPQRMTQPKSPMVRRILPA